MTRLIWGAAAGLCILSGLGCFGYAYMGHRLGKRTATNVFACVLVGVLALVVYLIVQLVE